MVAPDSKHLLDFCKLVAGGFLSTASVFFLALFPLRDVCGDFSFYQMTTDVQ